MANESVATQQIDSYGASPTHGNYTTDAEMHLCCANALSVLVACPDQSLGDCNDDIQDAVRYLLRCEVSRAMKAQAARRKS